MLLAMGGLVIASALSSADDSIKHVLIRHRGNVDPTTEGWRRVKIREGKIAEDPVTQDSVGGLDAWSIDDDGTREARVALSYQKILTDRELPSIETGRWKLTMCLRVIESAGRPNFSICGEVATSTTRYLVRFHADKERNTVVTLGFRGPILTAKVPGLGTIDTRSPLIPPAARTERSRFPSMEQSGRPWQATWVRLPKASRLA